MAKTKNINDIFGKLPEDKRTALINSVTIDGKVTYTTAWRYLTGQMTPKYLYQKYIAEKLSELTGRTYTAEQLWMR